MARRSVLFVALAVGLGLGAPIAAQAANAPEYNQRPFLEPGKQSKVQRVIVHGRTERLRQERETEDAAQGIGPNATIVNTKCGALEIGVVKPSGRVGERLPRENIVVAREIINAPNCGPRR